jgi:hypothetical protein
MLVWVSIATSDAPTKRVKGRMPQTSAAVIGSSVVFRFAYFLSVSTTVVQFASPGDASAWVEANRLPDD